MQIDGHLTVGGSSERHRGGLGSSGAGPSELSDARVKDLLEQGSGGKRSSAFFSYVRKSRCWSLETAFLRQTSVRKPVTVSHDPILRRPLLLPSLATSYILTSYIFIVEIIPCG